MILFRAARVSFVRSTISRLVPISLWPKLFCKIRIPTTDNKIESIKVIASDPGKEYPLVVTKQLEGR